MTDFLIAPQVDVEPQLVELIYERAVGPTHLLRQTEVGVPYYSLLGVERALDTDPTGIDEPTVAREWEGLGQVYLLSGTLQTLRWNAQGEIGSFHVGRVPEAARYRLIGEEHEYELQELLDTLVKGPVAFRGYPYDAGTGPQLQFTPALEGESCPESEAWLTSSLRLRAGAGVQRAGVLYQLYEEVDEEGLSTGTCYIGQRTPAGERLSAHSPAELAIVGGDWLDLLPKQV